MHSSAHTSLGAGNAFALGAAALAGGIIAAPYALPAIGVGDAMWAEKAISAVCGSGASTGLAGGLNELLAQTPVIGESLAQNGWANVGVIATVGIGGSTIASRLEKSPPEQSGFPWGKLVRYTALATSMLVALPSILTGISAGLVYLAAEAGGAEIASQVLTHLSGTLGTVGSASTIASAGLGIAASSHLLTCGLALAPATLPWLLKGRQARKPLDGMTLEAMAQQPLVAGQPTTLLLRLTDDKGNPVTPEQLAVVHEKKLHLFVADQGLNEYQHLHPAPTSQPGIYSVPFIPGNSGDYRIWAEATPMSTGREHLLRSALTSATAAPSRFDFRPNRLAAGDGIHVEWNASPPLRQGVTSTVIVTITDPQGRPVTLEPHLGAMAHIAGFNEDDKHFIHMHANETLGAHSGPLHITITPESEGKTRFFLEVSHKGRIVTTSFDQMIYPARETATEQTLRTHAAARHHSR